ncbi:corrinoid protein [bacterium]|nr:corrinoid protein [candidate division CSSED10-310 bacterium]
MKDLLQKAFNAVMDGDSELARDTAEAWLAAGGSPLDLVNQALTPGIREVGRLWEDGEYFLPELVSGAEAMKTAMIVLEPAMVQTDTGTSGSRVILIGTVCGDIHDIGKSLVATMLKANGFQVVDLGADVAPERFLRAFHDHHAALICMSALLTTTMTGIPELIRLFESSGVRSQVAFMAGGAPVTRKWASEAGVDYYGDSAVDAVRIATDHFRRRNG